MSDHPHTETKPSDLGDLLLADKSGAQLRNILNELNHHSGSIKAEINQGLSKQDFELKQSLLDATQLAIAYVQKFWNRNHQSA